MIGEFKSNLVHIGTNGNQDSVPDGAILTEDELNYLLTEDELFYLIPE